MARCSCGNSSCSCIIKPVPGGGVTVTGSGSPTRPYLLGLENGGNALDNISFDDTPSVNFTTLGAGTSSDEMHVTAVATPSLTELRDVSDPTGPALGEVPVWKGDHWAFEAQTGGGSSVPSAVSNGIGGNGSAGTPLKLLNSGVWGSPGPGGNGFPGMDKYGVDQTLGQPVYIDSAGVVRSAPQVLPVDTHPATDLSGAYPVGMSVMAVSTGVGGWPSGGTVVTIRRAAAGDGYIGQWFYPGSLTLGLQWRQGSPTGWSSWVVIGQDSGWVNITVNSGFAVQGSDTPQVRLLNGIVFVKGGWNTTGITASANFVIGNIPAGYRPQNTMHFPWGNGSNVSTALAMALVSPSGDITLRAGSTLPSYYEFGGQSWPAYA